MIVNRDPEDETTYEQCEEFFEEFPWVASPTRCRYPKGHSGEHGGWYFHPEGGWGHKTTSRISNELMKDETS